MRKESIVKNKSFVEFYKLYRQSNYFKNLKEFSELKNGNGLGYKIYIGETLDNFFKVPNIYFECICNVSFRSSISSLLWLAIYKTLLRENYSKDSKKFFIKRTKNYFVKMFPNSTRQKVYRAFNELVEKGLLIMDKDNDNRYYFTLNLLPVSWNLTDKEKERINNIVEKENERLVTKMLVEFEHEIPNS